MKRVLTIIALLSFLSLMEVRAQSLNVKSFELARTDLSARTHARKDNNGKDCALLKVRLALPNAEFKGMTVGKVEYKTSEYWVYLSPMAKKLSMSLAGYLPLDVVFSDYGYNTLESKTTYIMTVELPNISGQSNLLQNVSFKISPRNVEPMLYIDNKNFVVRNGIYELTLGAGVHTYRVEAKYYKTETGTLTLDGSSDSRIVEIKMRKLFGSAEISSNPVGADVLLNGKVQGQTPCKLPFITGKHTLQIFKKGYETKTVVFEIADENPIQIKETLSSLITFTIKTNPANSNLELNGENKGLTPCNVQKPAGKYNVTISHVGYHDLTKTINVDGSKSVYDFNLRKIYYKPTGGYVEGILQVGNFMSVGASVGMFLENVNAEFNCMLGLSDSEEIYWYSSANNSNQYPVSYTYSPLSLGGKVGYGFLLSNNIRLTPQVGLNVISLKGKMKLTDEAQVYYRMSGTKPAGVENSYVANASVGMRLEYVLSSNIGISLTPEYSFGVAKGKAFDTLANVSDKIKTLEDGFNCKFGFNIFF